MSAFIQTILCWVLVAVNWFCGLVSLPNLPAFFPTLDLTKFELTWSDEFDYTEFNYGKWGGHFHDGQRAVPRRDGYWMHDLCTFTDGALHIKTEYREADAAGNPAGWYSDGIDTSRSFRQAYGYFEARCILPKGFGLWSAFWIFCNGVGNVDGSGADGAEIDVFESPNYKKGLQVQRDSVSSAIHYDGYGVNHTSKGWGNFYAADAYEKYHTYGLEWNDKEYIFYIDGHETFRTDFGLSHAEEYVILSTEVGDWTGDINANTEPPSDFIIDYVRIYQYKDLL
ncbi:MAG: glycoside hydrolase family 16 protein [Oscillospiraceae bacterium]|nr:glycoside hydrolase family 16 protein [Oscillospiraceae bacterium]